MSSLNQIVQSEPKLTHFIAFRRGSMFGFNLDLRVVMANRQTDAQDI